MTFYSNFQKQNNKDFFEKSTTKTFLFFCLYTQATHFMLKTLRHKSFYTFMLLQIIQNQSFSIFFPSHVFYHNYVKKRKILFLQYLKINMLNIIKIAISKRDLQLHSRNNLVILCIFSTKGNLYVLTINERKKKDLTCNILLKIKLKLKKLLNL